MSATEKVIETTFKSHHLKLIWKLIEWKLSRQYHGAQSRHLTSPVFESPHCKWEIELQFAFDSTGDSKTAIRMRACLYLLECDLSPSSVVLQGALGIQRPGAGWYVYSKMFGVLPVLECKVSDYWDIMNASNVIEIVADFNLLVGSPVTQLVSGTSAATATAENDRRQAMELSNALATLVSGDEVLADSAVYVNNKRFDIHKAIFAARSPFFKERFDQKTKDKRSADIEIKCSNEAAWKTFQHFVYTGRTSLDEATLLELGADLLLLAEEYQVDALKQHLVTKLKSILSADNVIEVLGIAYSRSLTDLQEMGVELVKQNLRYFKTEKKEELVRCVQKNTAMAARLLDGLSFIGSSSVDPYAVI